MRLLLCLAAAALTLGAIAPVSAQTHPQTAAPAAPASVARQWGRYDATKVVIRDVAALVRVTPEDRSNVLLSIVNDGRLPAPEMRVNGNRLVIDGGLRRGIRHCDVDGNDFEVVTARYGALHARDLPVIELRVPRDVEISAGGAVRFHLAPARSAKVRLDGCGDADIVRVENAAEIAVSGTQDLRIYDAGSAEVRLAGTGDIVMGVVRSGLAVSVAGAGDFTAARVDGPTNIALQGAGDVIIRDGRATTLSVVLAGGGDVIHNGTAEQLDAVIVGGGDVRVRRVTGEVSRRVLGGGEVVVGR